MTILSDRWFKNNRHVIQPFIDQQVSNGFISYGLSSFGYDIRCGEQFQVCGVEDPVQSRYLDPKSNSNTPLFFVPTYQEDFMVIPLISLFSAIN